MKTSKNIKLAIGRFLFVSIFVLTMTACIFSTACTSNGENFKWLHEAYEDDWISQDDLKSIAFYYNNQYSDKEIDYGKDFNPIEIIPAVLEESTKKLIKSAFCEKYQIENSMRNNVNIVSYYGTYQNCIIIDVSTPCYIGGDPLFYEEYKLGDITFYNYHTIGVYKNI